MSTPELVLPAIETLTDDQRGGRACVWCGSSLDPGISDIDLGARPATRAGCAWFPRACQGCAHLHTSETRDGAPEPRLGLHS
ncbi:hypothetical protein G3I76_51395 [Streptomyces sp. SID11233]|uniref:hypothetical protein n=1 Tax=Streptomyces sp. SID11385 TaxID=2706031 RepID=UPI0013C19114|nr:hypothetical protein [Streptomyces sp. SID11385]NED88469.1 hypothetical protein [Streptomyces sp. SID11233]